MCDNEIIDMIIIKNWRKRFFLRKKSTRINISIIVEVYAILLFASANKRIIKVI